MNKFRITIDTPNSTVEYTIRNLEDDDFEAYKKATGRKGLQLLLEYLQGVRQEIYHDIVNNPIDNAVH